MPNYQAGKIYTIRSLSRPDLIYVGSTTQSLAKRLGGHRSKFKRWKAGKQVKYTSSFAILEIGDEYIELVESCPCDNKAELNRREGQLTREMECVNKRIEGRTEKEYRADNAEKIAEREKEYRDENKEKIAGRSKQYYEKNKERIREKIECECGTVVGRADKARHMRSKKHQVWQQLYDFITS